MKIIKNTLEVETSIWSDPGDYPNSLASGPLDDHLCVDCVSGCLVLQIEKEDRESEEWEYGPKVMVDFLLDDLNIEVEGVLITSWQFCPRAHPNPNDAAELDIWKIIPYKWDSDGFDL